MSLSRRCTMPGRATPPMPERLAPQWAISALTSVPVVAGARMHDEARGLVDDDQRVVLVDDVERNGLACRLGARRRRKLSSKRSPGLTRYFASTMVARPRRRGPL